MSSIVLFAVAIGIGSLAFLITAIRCRHARLEAVGIFAKLAVLAISLMIFDWVN